MNRNYRNFINTKIYFDLDKRNTNRIVDNWTKQKRERAIVRPRSTTWNERTAELTSLSWFDHDLKCPWTFSIPIEWWQSISRTWKCISDNFFDELLCERIQRECFCVMNFAWASNRFIPIKHKYVWYLCV